VIVVPSAPPTLEPVRPNRPPAAAQDLSLTTNPPLLREGAFISGATARLVKGKSGRWYALFEPDGSGRTLPPMIIMESSHLSAMERVAAREPSGVRVRLSGRITVYRDRNFFLPSAPPLMLRAAPADPDAKGNAASRAASAAASTPPKSSGTPTAPHPADPSVEQIIAELDRAVGLRRIASATGGTGGTTPDAGAAGMSPVERPIQEPTDMGAGSGFLTSRRARIVHGHNGTLAAVLDSGTAGHTEGPLTLLPCQNLTSIESIVDVSGESTILTLTGEVFACNGQRYLLPAMFVVVKPTDIVMPTH
jgi:hypothetical protein